MQAWFTEKRTHYLKQRQKLKPSSGTYSWLRISAFLLFVVVLILAISIRNMTLLMVNFIWFPIVFAVLVKYHNRIRRKMLLYQILGEMNARELKRLQLKLSDFPDGAEFLETRHAYSQDLDLFGRHSLYQLINRTVTPDGRQALVKALLSGVSKQVIEERQAAVAELSQDPDWLQHFLGAGLMYKSDGQNPDALLEWLAKDGHPKIPRWYLPVLLVVPAISLVVTIAFFIGKLAFMWLFFVLLINGGILYTTRHTAEDTYQSTHGSIKILSSYQSMISQLEERQFLSPLLTQIAQSFTQQRFTASKVIGQLQGILNRIEIRRNAFYWLFNIILLLDLVWLIQAARWKSEYRSFVALWFQAIGNYEFLASLALTSYANPHWTTPKITDKPFVFKAHQLGHPLILNKERVANDFSLSEKGSITILTGSNMSGKSTFLRTIGTNAVLAFMGGNCCASEMTIGEFEIFTSMRTTDSLEEHASSFYAELRRLNQLIVSLESGSPTMVLLDEVLKGTNSHDRHLGASALIRQLSESSSFGLVSTHDLSLGSLSEELAGIQNFSFNSKLLNGELVFDYLLTPGVCNSFNASQLMAQMGIAMEKADPPHKGLDGK